MLFEDEVAIEKIQYANCPGGCYSIIDAIKYDWFYSYNYSYWTMSMEDYMENNELEYKVVKYIDINGRLYNDHISSRTMFDYDSAVRPVINVYKSKISS